MGNSTRLGRGHSDAYECLGSGGEIALSRTALGTMHPLQQAALCLGRCCSLGGKLLCEICSIGFGGSVGRLGRLLAVFWLASCETSDGVRGTREFEQVTPLSIR